MDVDQPEANGANGAEKTAPEAGIIYPPPDIRSKPYMGPSRRVNIKLHQASSTRLRLLWSGTESSFKSV